MRTLSRGSERSRGQAMVELALTLPLLMLMLILIFDFSRVLYHSLVLANAARDGAWVATDSTATNATICDRVEAAAPAGYANCNTSTGINPSAGRTFNQGMPVIVTATYQYTPMTPALAAILNTLGVLSGGKFKLEQSVQMVIL